MEFRKLFFILAVSMTTAVVAGVQTGVTHADVAARGKTLAQLKEARYKLKSYRTMLESQGCQSGLGDMFFITVVTSLILILANEAARHRGIVSNIKDSFFGHPLIEACRGDFSKLRDYCCPAGEEVKRGAIASLTFIGVAVVWTLLDKLVLHREGKANTQELIKIVDETIEVFDLEIERLENLTTVGA